jgi:hypothetical protein
VDDTHKELQGDSYQPVSDLDTAAIETDQSAAEEQIKDIQTAENQTSDKPNIAAPTGSEQTSDTSHPTQGKKIKGEVVWGHEKPKLPRACSQSHEDVHPGQVGLV